MSKDPFEELFGPLSDDAGSSDTGNGSARGSETPTAPLPAARPTDPVPGVRRGQGGSTPAPAPAVTAATSPVPARQRLAHEQAERVHTSQQTSPGRSGTTSTRMPWIVVAAVAIIAIVVSIVVVNMSRGADDAPEATTNSSTSEESTAEPDTDSPSTSTPERPEPEKKPADEVPTVEVGPTYPLQVPQWGFTSEISQRFGSTSYLLLDDTQLQLTSDLLNSFPEECAAMREAWGATKLADGSYEVRKPADACAAAPELYDTVWGLTAAWIDTIKPQ